MKIRKYYKILVIAFFTSQSLYSDYSENDETVEFIDYMAQKHGYEKSYLETIFQRAKYQERVVRIMNRQPEGTMTWERYRGIMVNESRISAGKEFIKSHKQDLERAEKIYGVPAELLHLSLESKLDMGELKEISE